jgi:uncharacterized protein YfaS (alpha-2-macroglobulin family)
MIPSFADGRAAGLTVTLDATRLATLDSAINYVFHYPYGCMEQRSAAIYPLVIFADYIDALSLKSEVSNPKKVIEKELASWVKTQQRDGGFPYWPSGTVSNEYVSLRIAHILKIAQSKNINVPFTQKQIDSLEAYCEKVLLDNRRKDRPWNNYYSAYAVYVMSEINKKFDTGAIDDLALKTNNDAATLSYLGLAYLNIGKKAEAEKLIAKIKTFFRPNTRGVDIVNAQNYGGYYFGGADECYALTLQFFARFNSADEMTGRLLYTLLQSRRAGGYWSNTSTTVSVLAGVDALITAEKLQRLDINASAGLGGIDLIKAAKFEGLARPVSAHADFNAAPFDALRFDTALPLVINRNGRGALHYTTELRYAIPQELQSARDEGIAVFMQIYDAKTGEEIKGDKLKAGVTYKAKVSLSSTKRLNYVALRAPVPSGAEILDASFATQAIPAAANAETNAEADDDSRHYYNYNPAHQTIYANEVQYFWDAFPEGRSEKSFYFRAVRRGVYPTPPVQAECMYEAEVFGRTSGVLYQIE